MNGDGKYMRLGRRVVRMHAPVGRPLFTYSSVINGDVRMCCGCGYGVCSKVGHCAPRLYSASPEQSLLHATQQVSPLRLADYEPAPRGWTLNPYPVPGFVAYHNGPLTVTKAPGYSYQTLSDGYVCSYGTVEEACAAALRNTPCS